MASSEPASLVAAGDDDTAEDMFAVLTPSVGIGVHIGREPSQAQYRLDDWSALRGWLELVISQRSA
jgi:trehalose-6-phosphatase